MGFLDWLFGKQRKKKRKRKVRAVTGNAVRTRLGEYSSDVGVECDFHIYYNVKRGKVKHRTLSKGDQDHPSRVEITPLTPTALIVIVLQHHEPEFKEISKVKLVKRVKGRKRIIQCDF